MVSQLLRVAMASAAVATWLSAARAEPEPAIPPEQGELLLDMLGRGAPLPDDCVLRGFGVEFTVIKSTYDCSLGKVVVELSYPTVAEPAEVETDSFAIEVVEGSPPEGLVDALRATVAAHEADFVWVNPAARPAENPRDRDVAAP